MMQIPRKVSAHNVMASISRSLGTRHFVSKPVNEVKLAGQISLSQRYSQEERLPTSVRVLIVIAYIISVSLAAIVLSLYYMYIWVPSDYNQQFKRANHTLASTARTPCADVTPAFVGEPTTGTAARRNATSTDASTPLEGPSTESTPALDGTSDRDLLMKTLTSPRSDAEDYPSSTDLPAMASISSEQFQAMPAGDYRDGTIEPAEDLMDE